MSDQTLAERADIIKSLVGEADAAELTTIERTLEVGCLLRAAKADCRHGEWLSFLERAGMKERRARQYIQLAAAGMKPATVADLGGVRATLEFLAKKPAPVHAPNVGEMPSDFRLYNADCRDVLPTLTSVSHILTDPPYEAQAHKRQIRTHADIKSGNRSGLGFDAITEDLRTFIAEQSARLSKGWSIFFCQYEAVGKWQDAIVAAGGKYKGPAVWIKPDSSPQFSGDKPAVNSEPMALAWHGIGRSVWNAGGKRGTYTHNVNGRDRDGRHPTEKPVRLLRELLSDFTNPGDTILDPFMGSGSLGVACAITKRSYIGIERDARFHAIAAERIAAANSLGPLFADNDNGQGSFLAA